MNLDFLYGFMAWDLVKHRNNLTLDLIDF